MQAVSSEATHYDVCFAADAPFGGTIGAVRFRIVNYPAQTGVSARGAD
jgi:hypothetical protein